MYVHFILSVHLFTSRHLFSHMLPIVDKEAMNTYGHVLWHPNRNFWSKYQAVQLLRDIVILFLNFRGTTIFFCFVCTLGDWIQVFVCTKQVLCTVHSGPSQCLLSWLYRLIFLHLLTSTLHFKYTANLMNVNNYLIMISFTFPWCLAILKLFSCAPWHLYL